MTNTQPMQANELRPSPVIDTPRLRLRGMRPDDEESLFNLLSDERVVRYTLFPLFTRERANRFVTRVREAPAPGEPPHVTLAIAERSTDGMVGLCGLVLRPELEEAEVWYVLSPGSWGQGLVTEAARALVEHGFRHLGLHRIWASCLPENPASARVLEKLRFRLEGLQRKNLRIHGEWRDSYHYALLSTEWAAPADDRSTPAGVREAWVAAIRARNADGLRPLLADDYEVWANGAPTLAGVDTAVAAMRGALERFDVEQSFDPAETVITGEWAFERGLERMTVTPVGGGPPRTVTQRALLILRRGPDGAWQYARGMTNAAPETGS